MTASREGPTDGTLEQELVREAAQQARMKPNDFDLLQRSIKRTSPELLPDRKLSHFGKAYHRRTDIEGTCCCDDTPKW
jgi:hypothetical protein